MLGFFLCTVVAAGGECQLTIARLKYGGGGDWYANPSAYPNLVKAIRERTDLPVCDTLATVEIMDERLFRYPLVVMTGHGDVRFTARERVRLRAYLLGGGFLWADDSYGMNASFRKEIAALFPENALTELPADHGIYHARYDLTALPKVHELMEPGPRDSAFISKTGWCCFIRSVPISPTAWKTKTCITMAKKFTSWRSGRESIW
jgi:hypothetical protein